MPTSGPLRTHISILVTAQRFVSPVPVLKTLPDDAQQAAWRNHAVRRLPGGFIVWKGTTVVIMVTVDDFTSWWG